MAKYKNMSFFWVIQRIFKGSHLFSGVHTMRLFYFITVFLILLAFPACEINFYKDKKKEESTEKKVEKIPVEVTLEDRNLFYIVRGKLPDSLKNTYARISIKAVAILGCKTKGGWLLKITDGPEAEGSGDAGSKTEEEKPESVEGEAGAIKTEEKKSG